MIAELIQAESGRDSWFKSCSFVCL